MQQPICIVKSKLFNNSSIVRYCSIIVYGFFFSAITMPNVHWLLREWSRIRFSNYFSTKLQRFTMHRKLEFFRPFLLLRSDQTLSIQQYLGSRFLLNIIVIIIFVVVFFIIITYCSTHHFVHLSRWTAHRLLHKSFVIINYNIIRARK